MSAGSKNCRDWKALPATTILQELQGMDEWCVARSAPPHEARSSIDSHH
jgi:hypothetical protein